MSQIAASGPVPDAVKEQDGIIARQLSGYATWAEFHLDCLLVAIRHKKSIQIEVLPEIIDGLRAAVNAYACSRQGLNLRLPQEEPSLDCEWDEEDQELLDSSMADMAESADD